MPDEPKRMDDEPKRMDDELTRKVLETLENTQAVSAGSLPPLYMEMIPIPILEPSNFAFFHHLFDKGPVLVPPPYMLMKHPTKEELFKDINDLLNDITKCWLREALPPSARPGAEKSS